MTTVLQISDTHLWAEPNGVDDNDADASLAATIDAVRDVQADLLLLTGDLADDGSKQALERLRSMVGELPVGRIVAVAGNHDLPENITAVFGAIDTVEVGAWRVVTVESVIPGEVHGAVDAFALARRLDQLDARPTVVAIHHPPWSPSTNEMFQLIGAEQMLRVLRDRPHVRAVVSGHLHEVFDHSEGELQLFGAPSTCYAIAHAGDAYEEADDGLVGSQVLTLGDDGSISCERVARSLGC